MATWKKILLDVDNSVSNSNITDLAVTNGKIAAAAVTSAKIADTAVTNAKILDSAVTLATLTVGELGTSKIAGPAQAGKQLVGRYSSSEGAPLHALTVGANFNFYEVMIAHPDPQEEDIVGSYSINSRYPTITGTEDQIYVASANDSFTLTTPQNINTTSSPTFASLLLTGDLTVSGTTTTLNTENLTIKDKNILLSKGPSNEFNTSGTATGSGITIDTGANGGTEAGKLESLMPTFQWHQHSGGINAERNTTIEGGIGWLIRDNAIVNYAVSNVSDVARPFWSVVGCQFTATALPAQANVGMMAIVGANVYIGIA